MGPSKDLDSICHSSGDQESKVKGWFLLEASREDLLTLTLSSLVRVAGNPWCSLACRPISPISASVSMFSLDVVFTLSPSMHVSVSKFPS